MLDPDSGAEAGFHRLDVLEDVVAPLEEVVQMALVQEGREGVVGHAALEARPIELAEAFDAAALEALKGVEPGVGDIWVINPG